MSEFLIKIKLGPKDNGSNKMIVKYDKTIEEMVYDDLINFLYDEMEKEFPKEDYPKADISEIFINEIENDKKCLYPVLADSQFEKNKEKYNKDYKKILVLPEYTYELTPACKMSMMLSKHGLYDFDEYDMEKMNSLYEELKKIIGDDLNRDKHCNDDTEENNFNHSPFLSSKASCTQLY